MVSIDRYEKDLDALVSQGSRLHNAMQNECFPQRVARDAKTSLGDGAGEFIRALPSFNDEYQAWYSEAKALVRQLLPDRLSDLTRYYEKPKSRKPSHI